VNPVSPLTCNLGEPSLRLGPLGPALGGDHEGPSLPVRMAQVRHYAL
jgi:hypothetical protein